jgi:hypothetical protein
MRSWSCCRSPTISTDRLLAKSIWTSWGLAIFCFIYYYSNPNRSVCAYGVVNNYCSLNHPIYNMVILLIFQSVGMTIPYLIWSTFFSNDIELAVDRIHEYMTHEKEMLNNQSKDLVTRVNEDLRRATIQVHDENFLASKLMPSSSLSSQLGQQGQQGQQGNDGRLNSMILERTNLKHEYEYSLNDHAVHHKKNFPRDFYNEAIILHGPYFGLLEESKVPRFTHVIKSRIYRHRWCIGYWFASFITLIGLFIAIYYASGGLQGIGNDDWCLRGSSTYYHYSCSFRLNTESTTGTIVSVIGCASSLSPVTFNSTSTTLIGSDCLSTDCVFKPGQEFIFWAIMVLDLALLSILILQSLIKFCSLSHTYWICRSPRTTIFPHGICLCCRPSRHCRRRTMEMATESSTSISIEDMNYIAQCKYQFQNMGICWNEICRELDKWSSPFFDECYQSKYLFLASRRVAMDTRPLIDTADVPEVDHEYNYPYNHNNNNKIIVDVDDVKRTTTTNEADKNLININNNNKSSSDNNNDSSDVDNPNLLLSPTVVVSTPIPIPETETVVITFHDTLPTLSQFSLSPIIENQQTEQTKIIAK